MTTPETTDLAAYTALEGYWQFDRQFYEDFGMDLSPLEDDSTGALMPTLRRTAGLVVAASTRKGVSEEQRHRAQGMLIDAHQSVRHAMGDVKQSIRFDEIHPEHEAVLAWQERNSAKEKPDERSPERLIRNGNHKNIEISLARPRLDDIDPNYITSPFKIVTRPNANFYHSPLDETLPRQLSMARAIVHFDV